MLDLISASSESWPKQKRESLPPTTFEPDSPCLTFHLGVNAAHHQLPVWDDDFNVHDTHGMFWDLFGVYCSCTEIHSPEAVGDHFFFCNSCFKSEHMQPGGYPQMAEASQHMSRNPATSAQIQSLAKLFSAEFMVVVACMTKKFTVVSALNPFGFPNMPKSKSVRFKKSGIKNVVSGVKKLGLTGINVLLITNSTSDFGKLFPQIFGISIEFRNKKSIYTAKVRLIPPRVPGGPVRTNQGLDQRVFGGALCKLPSESRGAGFTEVGQARVSVQARAKETPSRL